MGRKLYQNKYRTDSMRLKGWDYAQNGMYFITIRTAWKGNIFGQIKNNKMILNSLGKITKRFLMDIPFHFPHIILDEFVVMPDHVHAVIIIDNSRNNYNLDAQNRVETQHCCVSTHKTNASNTFYRLKPRSLPVIIRSYKSICARTIHENQNNKKFKWQSSYYDRIIHDEQYLQNVRSYIKNNHLKHKNDY
ncbi:MAG: transposase [Candidatus Marinimicrobia bacterium]|nr:transposase [Candidatus Neomarinimicrobiota bacterium]